MPRPGPGNSAIPLYGRLAPPRRRSDPFVGHLVACDSLVCRAPLDLNDDRPSPLKHSDVLSRLERVLLAEAIRLMADWASVKLEIVEYLDDT